MIKKEELRKRTEDGVKNRAEVGLEWIRANFKSEAENNADKAYSSVVYPKYAADAIPEKVVDKIISTLKEDDHFREFDIKKLKASKGGYLVSISW